LKKPGWWLGEAGRVAREHPLWTAALGVGAGALAARLVKLPRSLGGLVSLAGKTVPVALGLWKTWSRPR
jgi:hypothetical protein